MEWGTNMDMERRDRSTAHVLLLPYPAQGHINPMLEFGKRLVGHGLRATIAVTRFFARSTRPEYSSVHIEQISDGCDAGGFAEAESIQGYLDGFKAAGSRTLADLISGEAARGRPVRCVVYDALMPWALDVAKGMGLLAATFFTQSCAVNALLHEVYQGRLAAPAPGPTVSIHGLLELGRADAPPMFAEADYYPAYVAMLLNQYSNLEKADTVLVNTFHQLEPQGADWMADLFPALKTIGPMVPSFYLDRPGDGDKHYGFDLFAPSTDCSSKWLDTQEPGSVVYVSFGSLAMLSAEQMEELARGLTASGKRFLWVVRAPEMTKLPGDFPAAPEKGLVVTWCPQLEVLAHPAVGCFVTHCGWNSTLEGLILGVPMVALPQWMDQPPNAWYVEAVWGTGVRARADETGIVRRQEVASRIKEVTDGARGEEMRENARRWKKLAADAVGGGGTSDRNILEFVDEVVERSEAAGVPSDRVWILSAHAKYAALVGSMFGKDDPLVKGLHI